MLDSQKLAIAAHLHVLLRRKTGRVTDTEWMVGNEEYAREVVRFARQKAREDGHEDLADWAAKLEAVVLGSLAVGVAPVPRGASVQRGAPASAPVSAPAPLVQSALERLRDRARHDASYVGGLR